MAQPIVNDLPATPTRGEDPEVFAAKANAFAGALPGLVEEINALSAWMVNESAVFNDDIENWLTSTADTVTFSNGEIVKTRYWFATQLNDPSSHYLKNETYSQAEVAALLNDLESSLQADVNSTNTKITTVFDLKKTDNTKPIFELSGSDLALSQDIVFSVNGLVHTKTASTVVTLPVLVSATDYKVYALSDGSLSAQDWDAAQPANSTELGGFHVYHTTGTINPSSIWDIKYRPICSPRAMTLSHDKRVWVDIYLMDVDYGINGFSQADAKIADGENAASYPIIPGMYGGDGTTTYGSLTWYEAWDLAIAAGKRLPFYGEFTGFAYGVVEQQAAGTDPVTTQYQAAHRSACGVEQATGCLHQWGADIQSNAGGGWSAITDSRGSVYQSGITAVLLGACWSSGSGAGSRASGWNNAPSSSDSSIGARASCDHLAL